MNPVSRCSSEARKQIRTSPSQFRNQSGPSQADHAGAEFVGEVELLGFAFEGCRQALFFGPGLIDFPNAFGERDLRRLGKRFAEGVGPLSLTWGPLKAAKCEKTG